MCEGYSNASSPGMRVTHLPLLLLQVLNRLRQGCSLLHIDIALYLLFERYESLSSLSQGLQFEHFPARQEVRGWERENG